MKDDHEERRQLQTASQWLSKSFELSAQLHPHIFLVIDERGKVETKKQDNYLRRTQFCWNFNFFNVYSNIGSQITIRH